jgi:hypothetical protein
MGKTIRVLFLTMMVVIFPLISWLYLREGIDFRKNALNEMEPIANLENLAFPVFEVEVGGKEDFPAPYYVIVELGKSDSLISNSLSGITTQLGQVPSVVLIAIIDKSNPTFQFSDAWVLTDHADPLALNLKAISTGLPGYTAGKTVYLIDSKRQLRNIYDLTDLEQMRDFAVHAGVLLPIKNQKDLVFKRKAEY